MSVPTTIYVVDAFTRRRFGGNPAAVVPLEKWLPDDVLQSMAAEHNLAETAYIVPSPADPAAFGLRWFTPALEMDLCGHATLAAAHVLHSHLGNRAARLRFTSRSGELAVDVRDGMYVLDFPSRPGAPVAVSVELTAALGRRPEAVFAARDLMAVYPHESDIIALRPDMVALAKLDTFAVIVTAPGTNSDFVSRFFAPRAGVPEDPVTGSAHCTLIPYWSARLDKPRLAARQLSPRGGEIDCELRGDRVGIGGHAVTYSIGEICAEA